MAAPERDTGAPDSGGTSWSAEINGSQANHMASLMEALAGSGNAADWNAALTWASGKLTQIVWTYQLDTSVKFKVAYTYTGSKLNTETWSFDDGLGGGYDSPKGGIFTYGWTGDELTSVTTSGA